MIQNPVLRAFVNPPTAVYTWPDLPFLQKQAAKIGVIQKWPAFLGRDIVHRVNLGVVRVEGRTIPVEPANPLEASEASEASISCRASVWCRANASRRAGISLVKYAYPRGVGFSNQTRASSKRLVDALMTQPGTRADKEPAWVKMCSPVKCGVGFLNPTPRGYACFTRTTTALGWGTRLAEPILYLSTHTLLSAP